MDDGGMPYYFFGFTEVEDGYITLEVSDSDLREMLSDND